MERLTKIEKETIVLFNEGEDKANISILVIKPVSFAAAYRLHGLCIQLAVVYRHVRINGGSHFHAYKTAAATAVRQQVFVVARPDERSVAPYLLNAASVGLAQVGNGFLQKVFQKALLMDAHLVEQIGRAHV